MAYFLTLVYIALYYIRPFDWNPAFREYPVLPVVGGVGFLCVIFSKFRKVGSLTENIADLMMIGFMLAIGLSHVSHAWFGGALGAMGIFLPSFIGYFLVVHSLENETKFEGFITLLIIWSVVLAIIGIAQYWSGSPVAGAESLIERGYDNAGNVTNIIRRIRWLGPFADPNDLAIAFVIVLPLLMYRVSQRRFLLSGLAFLPVLYALYLTNSRGAVLSVAATILVFFVARRGNWRGAVVASFLILLLLLIAPSRFASMSSQEESAHGRLEAWHEGFQILKQNPVFGSGAMTFTEYSALTAHNSFVLVFAELGLLGAFFFLGVFYVPLEMAFAALSGGAGKGSAGWHHRDLVSAMIASFAGVAVSCFFLSRSYTFLPYMAIGMVAAGARLDSACANEMPEKSSMFQYVWKILVIEFAGLLFLNLILKATL